MTMQKFGGNILEFKETKVRQIELELDPNNKLNDIKDNKYVEQCCFKNRLVDGFIIGATRAIFKKRIPEELSKNDREVIKTISISDLKDKDRIIFIIRIIAYVHLLLEAGNDINKKKDIHRVIRDLSFCIKIAEEYFKSGWERPSEDNFKDICNSEYPDSKLFDDISDILDKLV
ncbi:MAG: hypothetical protein ACTSVK_00645 [Promethearchaeota archaeon]